MKVYKVTSIDENNVRSSFTYQASRSELCLSYKVGQTTVPKCGKIFTFNNPQDAFHFATWDPFVSAVIMEGEGTNPTRLRKIFFYSRNFKPFWEAKKNKKSKNPDKNYWNDTVMNPKDK